MNEIKDLQLGMILEGVVSNVANFGALLTSAYTKTAWYTSLRWPIGSYKTRAKW